MKKKIQISMALIFTSVCCVSAQNQNNRSDSSHHTMLHPASQAVLTDEQFAKKAMAGGQKEIEMGNAAKSKASSPRVKNFADMMVTDHTKANEELKSIMTKKNWMAPAKNMNMENKWKDKTGADFDKNYMNMMVEDHKKTIDLFEGENKNGADAEIKDFANKTLPTIRMHLDSAMAIQSFLKSKNYGQLLEK